MELVEEAPLNGPLSGQGHRIRGRFFALGCRRRIRIRLRSSAGLRTRSRRHLEARINLLSASKRHCVYPVDDGKGGNHFPAVRIHNRQRLAPATYE
jgi:hypothetical protein